MIKSNTMTSERLIKFDWEDSYIEIGRLDGHVKVRGGGLDFHFGIHPDHGSSVIVICPLSGDAFLINPSRSNFNPAS